MLLNILNNSFDAIQSLPTKWIRIDVFSADDRLQLSVTDSGQGIPREVSDRMHEPFFTTKDVGKGTGLGLSISKGIIEDHDGSLTYDRKSPHTRFVIELPAVINS